MITLKAAPPDRAIKVNGPVAGDLALLWQLARLKFESRTGQEPRTRTDWNAVTADYQALMDKQRGSLGQVIREQCAEQPGGT